MKTLTLPEIHASRAQYPNMELLPTVAVLGAGVTSDGISQHTIGNARAAAHLMRHNLVHSTMALVSGKGPRDKDYKTTEAQGMASVIQDIYPNVIVIQDRTPINTRENIIGISNIAEVYGLDALTLVARQGQVERAVDLWKMYGKSGIEIVPVASTRVSSNELAIKQALRFATRTVGMGIRTDKRERRLDVLGSFLAPIKYSACKISLQARDNYSD